MTCSPAQNMLFIDHTTIFRSKVCVTGNFQETTPVIGICLLVMGTGCLRPTGSDPGLHASPCTRMLTSDQACI